MRYEFRDVKVSIEKRYALGRETTTDKHYLSFPVRNNYVDYIEYYEISLEQLNLFLNHDDLLIEFLDKCKRRKMDNLFLFYPIAPIRGYPT